MVGALAGCGLLGFRQQLLRHASDRIGQADEGDADHHVEAQVKQHDHVGRVTEKRPHMLQPHTQERCGHHHAEQLERHRAQGHLPGFYRRLGGGQHRQQAAAQVGAKHQAQRHFQRNAAGRRQCGDQQDDGQAGVGNNRQHHAERDFKQQVAAHGREQGLDRGRLREHFGGRRDQPQRQQHQAQADQNAAYAAGGGSLARDEQHDADENQQGGQP